jgi:hypothetical protein
LPESKLECLTFSTTVMLLQVQVQKIDAGSQTADSFLPIRKDNFSSFMLCNDVADTFDEGGRIELGANDFVRTVGLDSNAPVADESHKLFGVSRLDCGAKMFGLLYSGLSLNIDQHQIVLPGAEHGQHFYMIKSGIDFKT